MIDIELTNLQRIGLALFFQANWSAPEATLYTLSDAYDALKLEELQPFVVPVDSGGVKIQVPQGFDFGKSDVYCISESGADFILSGYPQAPTPAQLGRAKVALLKALREKRPIVE